MAYLIAFIVHIKVTTLLGSCKDMIDFVGERCAQINQVAQQENLEHTYTIDIYLREDMIMYMFKNIFYLKKKFFFQSTRSCQIAQAGLEFIILLPGLPQCWGYCLGLLHIAGLNQWKCISF